MTTKRTSYKAGELAELVGGKLQADPELEIFGVRGAASAGSSELTYATSSVFLEAAAGQAGLILLEEDLYRPELSALLVSDPKLVYARIARLFPDHRYHQPGQSDSALIGAEVELGDDVSIHPGVIIGAGTKIGARTRLAPGVLIGENCQIGEDVLLHPGVKAMADTVIGDRVEIQAGTVLGGDGFGYVSDEYQHYKIPHQGNVVVEDDVEIGALTAVDRAVEGSTVIGAGSKLDNLIQIGHNVRVGPAAIIVGQTGIGGSSNLGQRVTLAGQVGVEDHVNIADKVTVTGKAKVSKDIKEAGFYSGIPARDHKSYLKQEARLRRIQRMQTELAQLQEDISDLKAEISKQEE
ncbi:MAG: UDP-3-O-(3-hydroxymyristoyl)glucosamine N-acyltransferase [Bacillota bacterium]